MSSQLLIGQKRKAPRATLQLSITSFFKVMKAKKVYRWLNVLTKMASKAYNAVTVANGATHQGTKTTKEHMSTEATLKTCHMQIHRDQLCWGSM
jgi:hypothetical protein